jgi:hypothetical protein
MEHTHYTETVDGVTVVYGDAMPVAVQYDFAIPTERFVLAMRGIDGRTLYYPGQVLERDAGGGVVRLLTYFDEGSHAPERALAFLKEWGEGDPPDYGDGSGHRFVSERAHGTSALRGAILAFGGVAHLTYEDYATCVQEALQQIEAELMERLAGGQASREEVFAAVCGTYRGRPDWREWVTDALLDGTIEDLVALSRGEPPQPGQPASGSGAGVGGS